MSDIIQVLPDSVANQIAAGEVIQRPASVIKELVENAVDAGAKTIHVLVVDAGRTSIQVIDDGKGMSETDARLSFERHATSKIRSADDLFQLRTMGFRGEALASIAAVAQIELKTRQEGEELGTHLSISGSQFTGQEPCSTPVGSNFTVENLFFNVPARRKFLKSNTTELNNIITAFERIVLVYPSISFTLHSNGVAVYDLRAGTTRQRIVDLFGKRLNSALLPVKVETTLCNISGFVGKPESAKKKGLKQYFFVNGRYMKHPYFNKAVMTAFDRLVPVGEQVPYFLYFEINPEDIDVNIHPTKTEIKFENEQSIWQLLMAAVKESIGVFNDVPTIDFDTEGKPDIPVYNPDTHTVAMPKVNYNPTYNPFNQPMLSQEELDRMSAAASAEGVDLGLSLGDENQQTASDDVLPSRGSVLSSKSSGASTAFHGGGVKPVYIPSADQKVVPDQWEQLYEGLKSSKEAADSQLGVEQSVFPSETGNEGGKAVSSAIDEKSPSHYQYKGSYIMTAVKSGLMVIDQHRAHVRVLYEQYLGQLKEHCAESQKTMFPDVVQFSAAEALQLPKILPEMQQMGFELTDLGNNNYAVNAIPVGMQGINVIELVADMVATATEKGTSVVEEINQSLALSMARRAAITTGEVLSDEEMTNLVDNLFGCSNVNYTPDGKRIFGILRQQEIDHLFD